MRKLNLVIGILALLALPLTSCGEDEKNSPANPNDKPGCEDGTVCNTPDPEQPDPEQPDPEQPDPDNPKPDPEQPDPDNPKPDPDDPVEPEPDPVEPEPDPVEPDPAEPEPETPVVEKCVADEKKCLDNDVYACVKDEKGNTDWNKTASCSGSQTCDPEAFVCTDKCTVSCKVGELSCSNDQLRVMKCVGTANGCNKWEAQETCGKHTFCQPSTHKCGLACGDKNSDACKPFSIVLIPDTQYYTRNDESAKVYDLQMNWIANNAAPDKRNIKFAVHLGDITDHNDLMEWERASKAHKILDDAQIPYTVSTGNHDYRSMNCAQTTAAARHDCLAGVGLPENKIEQNYLEEDYDKDREKTHFGEFFNDKRFAKNKWFGGFYDTANSYSTFEVGDLKFLILALEFAPRKDTLCWAESIVSQNKDRYVIVEIHNYLTTKAQQYPNSDNRYSSDPSWRFVLNGANGLEIAKELTRRYSNIIMVLSGHVNSAEHRYGKTNNGNSLVEILCDYQSERPVYVKNGQQIGNINDACGGRTDAGGNGWMTLLTIDPVNTFDSNGKPKDNVTAKTFSVRGEAAFDKGDKRFYCSHYPKYPESNYLPDNHHNYSFALDFSKPIDYQYKNTDLSYTARVVNANKTGEQKYPRTAINPENGDHVVVWMDDSSNADGKNEDGSARFDIYARVFCAGGCNKVENIKVSENAGHQRLPDVAMDSKSNFVVVWDDETGDKHEVKMRGFKSDGSKLFDTRIVNSNEKGTQRDPVIAMTPGGDFVVAWNDYATGASQIMVRGFKKDGTELFHDRVVADSTKTPVKPAIAIYPDGSFVVAYQSKDDAEILARGFKADGSENFGTIKINTKTSGTRQNPAIAVSEDGSFYVAYQEGDSNKANNVIKLRGFDKSGKQIFADTKVSEKGTNTENPSICMDQNGNVGMVWFVKSGTDPDVLANDNNPRTISNDVYRRSLYSKKLTKESNVLYKGITSGTQNQPDIACKRNGKGVIVWRDNNDESANNKQNDAEIMAKGYNSLQ